MNAPVSQSTFLLEITHDGSPTYRLPNNGESMHHSGGAATETKYIYQRPIEWALKILPETRTMVVGLGLGYIEMAWAIAILKRVDEADYCTHSVLSFEIEDQLIHEFQSWIDGINLIEVYNSVAFHLQPDCDPFRIRNLLRENYLKNPFNKSIIDYPAQKLKFNVICFDAFSAKTNRGLWTEEFLVKFLSQHCDEHCVFTTYAATGILKRALKKCGFQLFERKGFLGKRDSTLAARGKFINSYSLYQTS